MIHKQGIKKINQLKTELYSRLSSDSIKIDCFYQQCASDLAVYKNNALYALIQVDTHDSTFKDYEMSKSALLFRRTASCRFFVIIKEKYCDVYEKVKGENLRYSKETVSGVVKRITEDQFWGDRENEYDQIELCLKKVGLGYLLSMILRDDGGSWYLPEGKTDDLFRELLSPLGSCCRAYRYTTLASLFESLKNKTYRLNCIVGMNDPTEIDYFEEYVGCDYLRYLHEEKNDIFISSCSTKADDLTMWRLYGDNAKGVCIEFDVGFPGFAYTKSLVSYADKNGIDKYLDVVKQIIQSGLDLRGLEKWKHFFKPYEYNIESEYRVLLTKKFASDDEKRKWVVTNESGILNPVYDIGLNEKPIWMTKIILGPKCPEKEINKKKLEVMMKENGISGIEVCLSKIKNYR